MSSVNSFKRSLPCDFEVQACAKAYCSELLDFSDSEATPEWLQDAGAADLELDNHFRATTSEQPSLRWPLEQPERALTFRVLNSRPELPEPVKPETAPELVEPVESASSDEEFFDYDSLDEPTTPPFTADEVKHLYSFRLEHHARSWDNEKLSSKKVRAAWSLIGPYAGENREASFEQVLLAAHSLNNTSLLTGLARQTMAPEATY